MATNRNRAAPARGRRQVADDDSDMQEEENLMTDQQKEEEAMFKQTFNSFAITKQGVPIERYEFPIILDACGYKLPDDVLSQMMVYLDSKNLPKVDVNMLLMGIRWYKDQQLTNDNEGDADEYLDAFVALGGEPNKDGFISKDVLVGIIKNEFELTIDMVEYLKGIGGDQDEINYYQFCVLLDAGTGGNPSRVSSYLSQNKGSSFMRFSYFERNMDRLV